MGRTRAGAAVLKQTTLTYDNIAVMIAATSEEASERRVKGYYALGDSGGGLFYWDATADKATANGGTIIDPDNIGGFDGTPGTRNAFLAAQGSGVGSGCWIRTFKGAVHVGWFGAQGDGVVDDSAAILAAITGAAGHAQSLTYTSLPAQSSVSVDVTAGGLYVIDTVTVPIANLNYNLRCIGGKATFVGANPATTKGFLFEQVRNITFENLNFLGFTTATEWDTDNVDSNLIRYIDCEFINCDLGVDTVSYAGSRSTVLEFIRCRTGGTKRLVNSYCDMTIIQDGHYRNADSTGCLIFADSELIINGGIFTPYTSSPTCRWIDITNEFSGAHGRTSVTINNARFGPEESGGIPVVYSFLDGNTGQSTRTVVTHIALNDCFIGSNLVGAPQGVIVLRDNVGATATLAPNLISVKGGSWNATNGLVVTENGLTTGYNVGQFVINIDPAAQGRLGSSSNDPSTALVGTDLEKFVFAWNIGWHDITATGTITPEVGGKKVFRVSPASATNITDLTSVLDGALVTLMFSNANTTIKDLSTGGNFNLAGGADFVSSADDVLQLIWSRGDADWHEVSRSVN